jgi:hypothetical protein
VIPLGAGLMLSSAHVRHPSSRFILPGKRGNGCPAASWRRPAAATPDDLTAAASQALTVVSNPIRMARRSLLTSACSQAPLAQLAEQRTLNPRVRGSSPWRRTRTDLGFYKDQVVFSCPFCPHVCSMFARAHGPSDPGLVKNGPSGARCGGNRSGAASSRTAGAAPGSLDQWSRPSRSGMRNAPGVPFRCRHIQ